MAPTFELSGSRVVKSLRYLLLLSCLAMVTACGQKGDLYFPESTHAASVPVALEKYGLF